MSVVENFHRIHKSIVQAAKAAGRASDSVALLVVSKTWEANVVQPLVEEGHALYGENRVQEASEKIPRLPAGLKWHLIGHLQKNKVRKVLPLFDTIHTVDSAGLARQIDRIAQELELFPRVFLQVNVGAEPQKFGFSPDELREQMGDLLALPRLKIEGLMAIPPLGDSPEDVRPHFQALRILRDELENTFSHPLPELSMGMTSDFEVAIQEGATIVRVGSAIFGTR